MELIAVCDSKTNTAPDFPIGWWSVARSHELKPGDVKAVSALDRELVVYRTESVSYTHLTLPTILRV